ncbi:signal recognition particle 9 kDa protein isoform X2 [Leptidea sinapis]|uniref:signal recognition particle 9 kDa protein isoform X2 n=1 Tax=Leptidea sinapis TaxID=189913 RepID=UPI00213382B1|nr:signal recognition particle 9 kDa protein isoform X2 [Leptidea sinapis]
MTFIPSWEEFEKSAEMLYLQDPVNTRYVLKYSHSKGLFCVKITDNKKMTAELPNARNFETKYYEMYFFCGKERERV